MARGDHPHQNRLDQGKRLWRGGDDDEKGNSRDIADDYPLAKRYRTEAEIAEAFRLIQGHTLILESHPFEIPLLKLSPRELTFRDTANPAMASLQDRAVTVVLPDSYYDSVTWLSDIFNEVCRAKCKLYLEKMTAEQYWMSIRASRRGKSIKENAEWMQQHHRGCTTFRPELMSGFIKLHSAKSVLDISSGWGDRLLGALAMGVRYLGVDPNSCLHPGYKEMIRRFGRGDKDEADSRNDDINLRRQHVIHGKFQEVIISGKYDMVHTSPPYFGVEEYSQEKTQSISEFATSREWYDGFLVPSLTKAWAHLREGGYMILHINNMPGKEDYVIKMRDYVSAWRDAEWCGIMGKVRDSDVEKHKKMANNKNGKGAKPIYARPVWIWRKKVMPRVTIAPLAEVHLDAIATIASEPDTMKNIADGKAFSREKVRNLIRYEAEDAALPVRNRKYFHRAVLLDDEVIGYVGLYPLESHRPTLDSRSKVDRDVASRDGDTPKLQVRIFITDKKVGHGYGTTALSLMLSDYHCLIGGGGTGATTKGDGANVKVYKQMHLDNARGIRHGRTLGFTDVDGDHMIAGQKVVRQVITLRGVNWRDDDRNAIPYDGEPDSKIVPCDDASEMIVPLSEFENLDVVGINAIIEATSRDQASEIQEYVDGAAAASVILSRRDGELFLVEGAPALVAAYNLKSPVRYRIVAHS